MNTALSRRYSRLKSLGILSNALHDMSIGTRRLGRKKVHLSQVSAETRLHIVKLAATKSRTHQEIADMFNIRRRAVSKLLSDVQHSKSSIIKKRTKEIMKAQNEGAIIYVINMMMDRGISVWSSK